MTHLYEDTHLREGQGSLAKDTLQTVHTLNLLELQWLPGPTGAANQLFLWLLRKSKQ